MSIIAFAGSNSSTSINHALVSYIANKLDKGIEVIRLTDFDSPVYAFDIEQKEGIPAATKKLAEKLATADKLIISVAEHNGNLTAFFKSHLDWLSRNDRRFLTDKKVMLLSTSPGQGAGVRALEVAKTTLPFFGAEVVATYSIPSFNDVFKDGELSEEVAKPLLSEVEKFLK
ncbi:NADPH-dependent FMN reductase [Otariodibacter sp.]|uniref:NADPH-dependent FMN reductase n=1 Tax=Otariodibacter sp. TaxID=3030919 RepID=UPI00260BDD44|nr:NADPH-dependent FMN reductase [Otariodibacter sp.]